MKIILYTHSAYEEDVFFRFLYSKLSSQFSDISILVVRSNETLAKKAKRWWRKIKRLGLKQSLEILSSLPLAKYFFRKDQAKFDHLISQNISPIKFDRVQFTEGVNSKHTETILAEQNPDVIIQAGAGILKENVFSKAKHGTINIHYGIAPTIRGMDSSYWAKWENRKDWLGSTVHFIDKGHCIQI